MTSPALSPSVRHNRTLASFSRWLRDDPRAAFALAYYALKAAQHIASMSVSIGGLDALIFTGGIGENAADVRDAILSHLSFLPDFEHYIIPANEERSMAMEILESFPTT